MLLKGKAFSYEKEFKILVASISLQNYKTFVNAVALKILHLTTVRIPHYTCMEWFQNVKDSEEIVNSFLGFDLPQRHTNRV